MEKHSEWKVIGNSVVAIDDHRAVAICSNVGGVTAEDARANAALIVRAVNAHAELVAALELALDQLAKHDGESHGWISATKKARAALAKAKA